MSERAAHLKDEGSRTQVVLAGMVTGLVSRFVVAPLDVVKIRLQLQSHPPRNSHSTGNSLPNPPKSPVYRGALDTIITIAQQEGITALWKGNIPAEALYILYGGVQFTTYRSTTALLHSLPPPLPPSLHPSLESFLSGASAGLAATFATYPLDLLRTRFAAQGTRRVYSGLFHAIRHIAAEEGGRGFFRGCGAAVASVVPYMGLFFSAYESLRIPLAHVHLPFGSGDATAGVLASVMAKTGTFPLDLVRKRLQVQGPTRVNYVHGDIPQYSGGVLGTMRVIVLQEGFRGLYRGLVVSLVKAAPTSAVTMWTYERVLKAMLEFEKGERVETH